MQFTVGSVPFLNAKPLVWAFQEAEDSPVQVDYQWPSRLPGLLDSGNVQAVLVSSIDALTKPGRAIAAGCSISSRGPVMSVRLFSKVPLDQIETLALDASSMTSNMLARIVLKRLFGNRPTSVPVDPDGAKMLEEHDACLLIGDKGLVFAGDGLYSLDLGEAWTNLTGLPFVWACWVGNAGLSPLLVSHLIEAREAGEQNLAAISSTAPAEISLQLAHRYLETVFDYRLGADKLEALATFGRFLTEDGLCDEVYEVQVVQPSATGSLVMGHASLA